MALQLGATHAAFLAAGVSETLAGAAAEELAAYDNRLAGDDASKRVIRHLRCRDSGREIR